MTSSPATRPLPRGTAPRSRTPLAVDRFGQPRTYRLQPVAAPAHLAYRRLAVAIVGLDIHALAAKLRAQRLGRPAAMFELPPLPRAA